MQSEHSAITHRISAQKSLRMPISTSPKAVDVAERHLRFGHPDSNQAGNRVHHRWGGNPATFALDDFEQLMVYLFSDHWDKTAQYRDAAFATEVRIAPPVTLLDKVKRIWEEVLPHRRLAIRGGKVEATAPASATPYNGSEMSDGERVIFYLIGECLSAPSGGIIIVDEPELHLHRTLQARLWNAVEAERSDCLFVYLTHDLDFATSRANSTKIWIKGFDGTTWEWETIENQEQLPEDILLEILGGRNPVLFVEGDRGSLDYVVYTHAYPRFTVIPVGGCEQVIHSTASFAAVAQLHAIKCQGLVDRDYRTPEEVEYLGRQAVHVLPVSEVENLFLHESVLQVLAVAPLVADPTAVIEKLKDLVLRELGTSTDRVVSGLAAARMSRASLSLNTRAIGEAALTASADAMRQGMDISSNYRAAEAEVSRCLKECDYHGALALFPHKGMLAKSAHLFNVRSMVDYVTGILGSGDGAKLTAALQAVLPKITV
jgi:hypothetical protein